MGETYNQTFTITRSKWLRGEGPQYSQLLRERDGKMCCLGQICEQLGVSREKLVGRVYPRQLVNIYGEKLPQWLVASVEMAMENDHMAISDVRREENLKMLASVRGVNLVFVD